MDTSKTLDLRPYGINHVLTPQSNIATFVPHIVARAHNEGPVVSIDGKHYSRIRQLGKGTYGTTYEVVHKDKSYALKVIEFSNNPKRSKENFKFFVCESIIQLILAKESQSQPNGPYVPAVHKIGYSSLLNFGFIVTDMMRGTLEQLLEVYGPQDNDIIIPDALSQVAHILDFFGKTLQFNHRDLKPDNIMYIRNGADRHFKLIDFGFSCIHWHGLQLQGNDYFKTGQVCYKPERDLAQLVYYIYMTFPQNITPKLDNFLHNFLHVRVGVSKCNMSKSCPRWHLHAWRNTYDFLNRKNVHAPATSPNVFLKEVQRFKNGLPFKGFIHNATRKNTDCPPGKIRNPKTYRCIKKPTAKVPLMKQPCAPGKIRNPKTHRCIKKPAAKISLMKQPCTPGKMRNPKTGRCIKTRKAKNNPVVVE